MFTPNYSYPWTQNGAQQDYTNNINWVQGETGAKSFMVAPRQSVLLMDSENNVFYIKSADNSGMPMPLRIFDYTERITAPKATEPVQPSVEYVTREEFEKRLKEISNAEQRVSTTKQQSK